MKYRRLGRTNFMVSEIGHGLWGMGSWSGSSDNVSRKALQIACDLGCNFFDTAWAYGNGKSDALLGELLQGNRARKLYVAAKIPPKNMKWPASAEDSYEDVFPIDHVLTFTDSIRNSLRIDRIDLLQLHVWDDSWSNSEVWKETVRKLKAWNLIEAFGISLNRWEPNNGIRAVKTGQVDTVQVIYNIFDQSPEDELIPICRALDVGVIARVPLDEGGLGGNLTPETEFPADDWRAKYFGPQNLVPTVERAEALKKITPPSMTLPEMALRFILSNPDISTTIVGMRRPEHIRKNVAVSDGSSLEPDLMRLLRQHRWDRAVTPWAN